MRETRIRRCGPSNELCATKTAHTVSVTRAMHSKCAKEGRPMVTRKTALTVFGGLLGLVLAAGSVRAMTANRLTYLTFSGPVSLPGVSLGTGTYAFELVDSNMDLVRVRNKDRTQVFYTGFTNRIEQPAGRQVHRPVVFGEA